MLIKIHSYAKAASYHFQQAYYFSMSFQPFHHALVASVAALGFQQAYRAAATLLSVSWHSGFCHWPFWLVCSLLPIRPSLALFTALLRVVDKKKPCWKAGPYSLKRRNYNPLTLTNANGLKAPFFNGYICPFTS